MKSEALLSLEGVRFGWPGAGELLHGIDLQLKAGQCHVLLGRSGCGKTSLLKLAAGLLAPSGGTVRLQGQPPAERRADIGFVFQAFHVLPHLDVAQNVALPLMLLQQQPASSHAPRVEAMLTAVGLQGLGARLPQELSGGQLQRVAIARALVHRPALLLADEPTGNLDPSTAARVMDLLLAQTREHGAALVLVTHSEAAAARADRTLHLTPRGFN